MEYDGSHVGRSIHERGVGSGAASRSLGEDGGGKRAGGGEWGLKKVRFS